VQEKIQQVVCCTNIVTNEGYNGWSDKGFNELLQFFNDLLPKANVLPQSMYQAKKIICQLGLEVEKIHACRNDCMLFRNKDSMFEKCHVCGISRYKQK
jgi:hypothetical protein